MTTHRFSRILTPANTSIQPDGSWSADWVLPGLVEMNIRAGRGHEGYSQEFVLAPGEQVDLGEIRVRPCGDLRLSIQAEDGSGAHPSIVQFLVRDEGGFWHEWRIHSYGPRRYSSTVVRGLPRKMLYVIAESANPSDDSFEHTVWRAEGEIDNSSGEEQEVELIARRATEVSLEVNNGLGHPYSILDEGGHTLEQGRLGLSPVTVWLLPGSYLIEFEDGTGNCRQESFAVGTRWTRVDLH